MGASASDTFALPASPRCDVQEYVSLGSLAALGLERG